MKEEDLKLIINAIESGKCLAFLGAGACTPFKNHKSKVIKGLPTGGQLAKTLAEKCQYSNGNAYDLLKVAEYFMYAYGGDRDMLEKAVREEIQKTCAPRPIHTVLAQLEQVKIIITSNYDNLMEEELRKYGRKLTRNVYNRQNSRAAHFNHSPILEKGELVLHKMHGTIEEPESIVITESDYISYLANLYDKDRGMPEYFRKTWIPFCTLLFLGYGLADWNFRVIWEGVLSGYAQQALRKEAYALVMGSTHFQRKYWSRKNVDIFDQDLTEFAVQLAGHFNLEIPQLGIEKQPQGSNQ
ncbi:MAG: SIR2 family protein [Candidatus Aminicenantes bacterium]|nr:MAG: SIR2 family protein [Candidatus Aminicenantes bacterium]